MEDKQLNLNQPLLSVRRYSSIAEKDDKKSTTSFLPTLPRPPPYKSELKSGPVRNPGVVPFVWEQSPGKPKDESRLEIHKIDRPPTAPKLPPGRILKANQEESDNAPVNPTINKNQVRNPDGSQRIPAMDEMTSRLECFEDTVEEEEEHSDSGDDSEVYVDALDTLSRTESFFLNCSVSGVSGLDDQDVKNSGTFSTDPQARDFMIGRFLPAAKAMVSETQTPQYVPKKQPVIQDQPRQLRKVVNADKQPQLRYGPSFVQHYTQSQYDREDSDEDYDESGNLPTKVCGLLPRFSLRSSFCLLNPVPGMSVRTRVPMSPASRAQTGSSSASTCSKTENEQSSFDISEQRSTDGFQTTELHEEKNGLNDKPRQICSDSQKLEGAYPHRNFQSGGMSHCQKESSMSYEQRSVPGISREEKNSRIGGFSSHEKNYKSFRELLANQSNSEELDFRSPAVEKTVYIDTVNKGEYPHKKSCSSEGKELSNIRKQDNEIPMKGMEENFSTDSRCIEKFSIAVKGVKLQNNFHKAGDFNNLALADEPNQDTEKMSSQAFGQDEKLYLDAISSVNLEMPDKETTKDSRKQASKTAKSEPEFPIPPPLPKSPSDSWLCRTLPSMHSRNSSLHSHFGTGINPRHHQASKTQSTDAKWETIVKTTKVQQHHFRYSEELLAPIQET